ncbi:uncharacterized protein N7473_001182 [Penicillium subrubescens]|nr:uncharacterized protein N7473_001182 [Penicillium subrubescens]KAJ5911879.1 hypothetical protein N7473_001182 [Penicillium subrubescens]
MRAPLGSVDTRLKMTDTPEDGLLASSFASITRIDDLLQRSAQPLDSPGIPERKMNRVQFASDRSHGRGIGKPYPRLELDVNLDHYHSLDNFTEPVSPRNTPASISCCASPGEPARPRTSSAPQIQSLAFEWLDGKSEGDLKWLDGNTESGMKAQKRRFSVDDEPRSSTTIPPKDIAPTAEIGSSEQIEDVSRHVPGVRSSPPPVSLPKPHSPPADRSSPAVGRKIDYVSPHCHQKHFKKWRGSNHAQRVSPYRSPPKARSLNRQLDAPFSYLLPSLGLQGVTKDSASQTDPSDETVEHNIPEKGDDVAIGATEIQVGTPPSPVSDFVGLSLSIRQVRHPGQQSALTVNGGAFQVELTSVPFPLRTSFHDGRKAENPADRPALDDLVFHTYLVLPVFVAQFPVAVFSVLNRACNSRIGTILLYLEKMFWSIVIAFFLAFLAKFRRPGTGPGYGPGGPGVGRRKATASRL